MAKVEKQNLLADFSGARVYVHGAAFVPTQNKNGYRSGKMIQNLESFWKTYFSKSNADLAGFGSDTQLRRAWHAARQSGRPSDAAASPGGQSRY